MTTAERNRLLESMTDDVGQLVLRDNYLQSQAISLLQAAAPERLGEHAHFIRSLELDGVLDRIKVPFLVTHGEKDSQIPLKWAERTYAQLTNSPKRELKIFTEREGGVQHSSFDNSANAGQFIADWVAEILGGHTA